MHVLITGGAGFIGSHLVDSLLADGHRVTVVDNFDPFYDASIKFANISAHRAKPAFRLVSQSITDLGSLEAELNDHYDVIVHLAAKAGVRPSLMDPMAYQVTNIIGTQNMLTFAKQRGIRQFVFASSSSVYGDCPRLPWSEFDNGLLPINPYASTKLANEHLAYVYAKTFGLRCVGLRFFTVYGPRQRPDLAIHKFTKLMLAGEPIPVFGDGSSARDYTFCSDIVRGVRAAIEYVDTDFEVFNLGNTKTVTLSEMVETLADAIGVTPRIQRLPWQPGEMPTTWANIDKARAKLGYSPAYSFPEGIQQFLSWYRHGARLAAPHDASIAA